MATINSGSIRSSLKRGSNVERPASSSILSISTEYIYFLQVYKKICLPRVCSIPLIATTGEQLQITKGQIVFLGRGGGVEGVAQYMVAQDIMKKHRI